MLSSVRSWNKKTKGEHAASQVCWDKSEREKKRGREEGKRQGARDRTGVGGREEGGEWHMNLV